MENWVIFAASAAVLFAGMQLLIRLALNKGVRSDVMIIYVVLVTALVLACYVAFTHASFSVPASAFWLILIIGFIGAIANVLNYNAIRAAANPGYAIAFTGLQIVLLTIASYFVFKAPFSLMKFGGVILVAVGTVLLVL